MQGQYIKPYQRDFQDASSTEDLEIEIEYLIPPIHQSIVIVASALQPNVETINSELYRKTLFARDDQLLDTLAAGIGLFPQLSYISRV